jgi:heme-degrading monooxygenase HmoA
MLARVATFNTLPDDLDDGAVDVLRQTIRNVPGYVAGFHLRDPETNKALSVTVYEDRDAVERVREAMSKRPDGRKVGIDPDHVEFFEAFRF